MADTARVDAIAPAISALSIAGAASQSVPDHATAPRSLDTIHLDKAEHSQHEPQGFLVKCIPRRAHCELSEPPGRESLRSGREQFLGFVRLHEVMVRVRHQPRAGAKQRGPHLQYRSRTMQDPATLTCMNRWFAHPTEDLMVMQDQPRLASWNKHADAAQVRLREYLENAAELVAGCRVAGPWTLLLDVGLPNDRDLTHMADLDNYALPLAARLRDENLVCVWCTKRHAPVSRVGIARAEPVPPPAQTYSVRTTASVESRAYKEQIRASLAGEEEILDGPVMLQISLTVGPGRNWLNLWKPTIDALDPLLGRTRVDRDWHPRDDRITTLGLHLTIDETLSNDVLLQIAVAAGHSAV